MPDAPFFGIAAAGEAAAEAAAARAPDAQHKLQSMDGCRHLDATVNVPGIVDDTDCERAHDRVLALDGQVAGLHVNKTKGDISAAALTLPEATHSASCDATAGDDLPLKKTSQISSSVVQSVSSVIMRETYRNGHPRPLLRGLLHGVITLFLVPTILVLSGLLSVEILPKDFWLLLVHLLAKFLSYGASASLHLYPFQTQYVERRVWKADLTMIPVSVWGTCSSFLPLMEEFLLLLCIALVVTTLSFACTVIMGKPKSDRSRKFRKLAGISRQVILLLFFFGCSLIVGWRMHFETRWGVSLALYLLGFFCFAGRNCFPHAPWHSRWSGWHEDFHLLVSVGDVIMIVLAVQFIEELA